MHCIISHLSSMQVFVVLLQWSHSSEAQAYPARMLLCAASLYTAAAAQNGCWLCVGLTVLYMLPDRFACMCCLHVLPAWECLACLSMPLVAGTEWVLVLLGTFLAGRYLCATGSSMGGFLGDLGHLPMNCFAGAY